MWRCRRLTLTPLTAAASGGACDGQLLHDEGAEDGQLHVADDGAHEHEGALHNKRGAQAGAADARKQMEIPLAGQRQAALVATTTHVGAQHVEIRREVDGDVEGHDDEVERVGGSGNGGLVLDVHEITRAQLLQCVTHHDPVHRVSHTHIITPTHANCTIRPRVNDHHGDWQATSMIGLVPCSALCRSLTFASAPLSAEVDRATTWLPRALQVRRPHAQHVGAG